MKSIKSRNPVVIVFFATLLAAALALVPASQAGSPSYNAITFIRVQNNDSSIKAVPALPSPMADPDNQHVRYTFQLIKQ